ncbi:MAG: cache domain-containing protein, partial [Tistlia sp.]
MVDDRTEVIAAEPAVSDAVAGPARSRWGRPRPISFYLLLLPLVTLVPAFLYAGLVLERNNEAQREVVETLVYGTAGSIAQSVDRELSAMTTTLRVLATLPSLDRGDFETFHSRAQAALQGSHSYMILLDDRFQQLANTRVAFGDPLGSGSDPDSARTALESGAPAVSEVFFGQTSGLWVFNVAMPVVGDDGRDRILILTRDAATLSDKLTGHRVPAGWKVALLDAGGTLIASSDPAMP